MRTTKPVSRITNRSPERAEAEKPQAGGEPGDFQESDAGTYSYATRTVFSDPKTGRRVPASVGIVVSKGSVMMWLKT
jgi:hypothetical protein